MQIYSSNIINLRKIKVGVGRFLKKNKRIVLTILFIFFFVSLYFLVDFSSQSLVAHDEGLYARRSRLIESSENWFSPPFESPHHKTLGSYWFIALSLKLFGNSELALRLPSILSSFLCLICTYLIALKITNKKSALISLFSVCSMPLWIQYSRYSSPDFPFVLCILLVILFFLYSLDYLEYKREYIYIFLSGFFLSISFFIRSYMSFVPLIGLTPFFSYHLRLKNNLFKISFLTGIFIGFIPTLLNLYFSYNKFGIIGITSLFDFAKKQAVSDYDFTNLILFPLKFLYFTFPIGLILVIISIFNLQNIKIKHPLLVYYYPLISLLLLISMSKSYPHYYLFLLPSLSIIFSTYLTSNSFRFSFSRFTIRILLIITLVLILSIQVFLIISFDELVTQYSYGNRLIIYVPFSLLLFSYFTSIIYLFDIKSLGLNLIKFTYNIVIFQYVALSLFFNFGVLGNPNYKTKLFLRDEIVSSIINSNTIYLFGVESKTRTLLSYYLPYSKVLRDNIDIEKYKYLITSDRKIFENYNIKQNFIPINKFDNHILLMNINS